MLLERLKLMWWLASISRLQLRRVWWWTCFGLVGWGLLRCCWFIRIACLGTFGSILNMLIVAGTCTAFIAGRSSFGRIFAPLHNLCLIRYGRRCRITNLGWKRLLKGKIICIKLRVNVYLLVDGFSSLLLFTYFYKNFKHPLSIIYFSKILWFTRVNSHPFIINNFSCKSFNIKEIQSSTWNPKKSLPRKNKNKKSKRTLKKFSKYKSLISNLQCQHLWKTNTYTKFTTELHLTFHIQDTNHGQKLKSSLRKKWKMETLSWTLDAETENTWE